LCTLAECHLQLGTPDTADDVLEDFIEHHPNEPELPTVFKKLDQLYRAERASSPLELRRWANDPAQPRRALAQWYLARSELRAGHRENAGQLYRELRKADLQVTAPVEGLVESAELEL